MAAGASGQATTGEGTAGTQGTQTGSNASASEGVQAGGNDDGASTSDDDGDESENESELVAELNRLKTENARLAKQLKGTQRAADQGRSQASSMEQRLAALEADNAKLKADAEAKDKALQETQRKERSQKAIAATAAKVPEAHREAATDALIRLSAEGELDFSAEDSAPVVEKALKLLQERRPKLFEKETTIPVHPMFRNGVSGSKSGKPDWRDKDGERIF